MSGVIPFIWVPILAVFLLCIFDDCAVVGQEKPTY